LERRDLYLAGRLMAEQASIAFLLEFMLAERGLGWGRHMLCLRVLLSFREIITHPRERGIELIQRHCSSYWHRLDLKPYTNARSLD
jgi:hypothetical protein